MENRSKKTAPLTIWFSPEDLAEIKAHALEVGLGPTSLARMWVLERLRLKAERSRA
jgi:hypothetical protein